MSIILNALKNHELREEKGHTQVIDDWDIGQMDAVVSSFDDSISLGPQGFVTHTYTTLYLVLSRKINTTSTVSDTDIRLAKESAAKSIHHDVYGELLSELDELLYHMSYSGKDESMKKLTEVMKKWSI